MTAVPRKHLDKMMILGFNSLHSYCLLSGVTNSMCNLINSKGCCVTSACGMFDHISVLKVRGPFVETFCIEKDSYMDAI